MLSAQSAFCQNIRNFETKFDWKTVEKKPFTEQDLANLFPTIKDQPFRTLEAAKNSLSLFHFVDYNNDGEDDIFYNGWSGGEGTMLLVITSTGTYKIDQYFSGRVQNIKMDNGNIKSIEILDYSCCAGYVDHLQLLNFDNSTNQFLKVNDYAIITGTPIPTDFFEPIKFSITNEFYNLRTDPEIQKMKNGTVPFDPIKEQNISAVYTAGDTGTAIAAKTDSTGRIWWFVIMDDKPISETIFYDGNNDFETYQPVGWLSSRFVKKVE